MKNFTYVLLSALMVGIASPSIAAQDSVYRQNQPLKNEWLKGTTYNKLTTLSTPDGKFLVFKIIRNGSFNEYALIPDGHLTTFGNKRGDPHIRYLFDNVMEKSGRILTEKEYSNLLASFSDFKVPVLRTGQPFRYDRDLLEEAALKQQSEIYSSRTNNAPIALRKQIEHIYKKMSKDYSWSKEDSFILGSFIFSPSQFKLIDVFSLNVAQYNNKENMKFYNIYEYNGLGFEDLKKFVFVEEISNISKGRFETIQPENRVLGFSKDNWGNIKERDAQYLPFFFVEGNSTEISILLYHEDKDFQLSAFISEPRFDWNKKHTKTSLKVSYEIAKNKLLTALENGNKFKTEKILVDGQIVLPDYVVHLKSDKPDSMFSGALYLKKASSLKWENDVKNFSDTQNFDDFYILFNGAEIKNRVGPFPLNKFVVNVNNARVIHKNDLEIVFDKHLITPLKEFLPTLDTHEMTSKKFIFSFIPEIEEKIISEAKNQMLGTPLRNLLPFEGGRIVPEARDKDQFIIYVPSILGKDNEYHYVKVLRKQIDGEVEIFNNNISPGMAEIYLHQIINAETGPLPKKMVY